MISSPARQPDKYFAVHRGKHRPVRGLAGEEDRPLNRCNQHVAIVWRRASLSKLYDPSDHGSDFQRVCKTVVGSRNDRPNIAPYDVDHARLGVGLAEIFQSILVARRHQADQYRPSREMVQVEKQGIFPALITGVREDVGLAAKMLSRTSARSCS